MSILRQILIASLLCTVAVGGWVHFSAESAPAAPGVSSHGERGGIGRRGGFRRGGEAGAARVVTADVIEVEAGDRLAAIGTAEASRSVALFSRTTGIVTDVTFTAGDTVRAGEVLVLLDDAEERLAVEQARIALDTAVDTVSRYEQLSQRQAISNVQLAEARATLASARNTLATAELALDRRGITAPFDGVMGFSQVDVGDMMTASTQISTIDDRSTLYVEFRVPERYAGMLVAGAPVDATTSAFGAEGFSGRIEALDSRVDASSRTLLVRAGLPNPDDRLRPGMAFSVDLRFDTEGSPAVPKVAVQWDRNGSYVWKVVDGKAVRTPVNVVRRTPDMVLVAGDIAIDDVVVAEGIESLSDGADVAVAGETPRAAARL